LKYSYWKYFVSLQATNNRVSRDLIGLVEGGRAAIAPLLQLDSVIDLVIPRGSNALVQHIKSQTRIPVLGHADGVCHIYVDTNCDLEKVCSSKYSRFPVSHHARS
jgi:gamma-glutamyl phosphate reductase